MNFYKIKKYSGKISNETKKAYPNSHHLDKYIEKLIYYQSGGGKIINIDINTKDGELFKKLEITLPDGVNKYSVSSILKEIKNAGLIPNNQSFSLFENGMDGDLIYTNKYFEDSFLLKPKFKDNKVLTIMYHTNPDGYDEMLRDDFVMAARHALDSIRSHKITAHFASIKTIYDFYDNNKLDYNKIDSIRTDFFNLNNSNIFNRNLWKSEFLNNLRYSSVYDHREITNLKAREEKLKYLRLFDDRFVFDMYDKINKLFSEKYDKDILKGKFTKDITFVEKFKIKNTDAKIHMIGDIHGSIHLLYHTLINLPDAYEDNNTWKLKENIYIIFLGDIVDYSFLGLECLALVFILYMINPSNVLIINGNHEDKYVYTKREFGIEIMYQLMNEDALEKIDKLLYYLPSAVYLEFDNKIYHLSHGVFDIDYCTSKNGEKSGLKKFLDSDTSFDLLPEPEQYMPNQYKWGDLYQSSTSDKLDKVKEKGGRGVFSRTLVNKYINDHNLECIISGHQDNIALGLMTNITESDGSIIKINKVNYAILNKRFDKRGDDLYDLYVPFEHHNKNRTYYYNNTEPIDDIILQPKVDFIALVTSNAAQAKPTHKSCYLTLQVDA